MPDSTNLGKKAEQKIREWLNQPEQGFYFYRIPDQLSGQWGSSNPCDFFLYKHPYFYLIESKATYEARFPFDRITPYQKDKMLEASRVIGVRAYVMVLFATEQRAFLFDIRDIDGQEKKGTKSVNINKIDKWELPFIEVKTIPSRKALLDYDPKQAIF